MLDAMYHLPSNKGDASFFVTPEVVGGKTPLLAQKYRKTA
jgi:ATP-dependent Clp protease ATP-binding subunit ClpX